MKVRIRMLIVLPYNYCFLIALHSQIEEVSREIESLREIKKLADDERIKLNDKIEALQEELDAKESRINELVAQIETFEAKSIVGSESGSSLTNGDHEERVSLCSKGSMPDLQANLAATAHSDLFSTAIDSTVPSSLVTSQLKSEIELLKGTFRKYQILSLVYVIYLHILVAVNE